MSETEHHHDDAGHDFTFTIDGEEVPARHGDTILKAALRAGRFIPHYCWHPGLSIAGNCRICLVFATKAGPPHKPVIACSTQAVEGMEVESDGPRTKAAREGVMEFLLINHPLDCPVCDQAGECDLQQYSYDYGRETSPFVEPKIQRHRKDFGPLIRFAGNRCIVCTRCVRFTDEVTGTGELAVVQRGDSSVIDTFPGVELDNPLSGCTADICPVGALLDRDSIHTTRTWLLRGTKSACGRCATGCNVNVETWREEVHRVTPRANMAVNRWWMCDEGRLSYKEAHDERRLRRARVGDREASWLVAMEKAQDLVRAASAADGKIAAIVSGFASNEELFLVRQLLGGDEPLAVGYAADGAGWRSKDGFEISADRNPNRGGVERMFGKGHGQDHLREVLDAGDVSLLLVVDATPGGAVFSDELIAAAVRAPRKIALALSPSRLVRAADVTLPALHWTEKDGTMVNGRGRLQRLRAAVPPPEDARPELEALQELAVALGRAPRVLSAGGVFRRLQGATSGFGGIDYAKLGEHGLPLPGAADRMSAEDAAAWYEAGPVSRGPGRADDEQTRVSVHRFSEAGVGTLRGDV